VPDSRLLLWVAGLFVCGAAFVHLGHLRGRQPKGRRRGDWVKFGVYAALINTLWASAYAGRVAAAAALAAIAVLGVREVAGVVPPQHRLATVAVTSPLFCGALGHIVVPGDEAWRDHFVFVVVVTAATDSFAQVSGRLLGRRRLCPRLSPHKTVAGLWGGIGMAVAVSLALGFLVPEARGSRLALLGLATASGAVVGDLLFSAVKRAAGVKDFSNVLPGHGGVLDRFDSLLVAAPAFHWAGRSLLG
jgi:CDP-diglyceride synthetase